jgi:non-ribosomal peptide synthetase component F
MADAMTLTVEQFDEIYEAARYRAEVKGGKFDHDDHEVPAADLVDLAQSVPERFVVLCRMARASLSRTEVQGVVPAGWKLVPVEPTREMIRPACAMIDDESPWPFVVNLYTAMLAAAPPPPAPSTDAREGEDLVTMPRWVAERVGRFYVPKEDSDAIFSRREAIRLYHAALASGGRANG